MVQREARIAALQALTQTETERTATLEQQARSLETETQALREAGAGRPAALDRLQVLQRAVAAETRVTTALRLELSKLQDLVGTRPG